MSTQLNCVKCDKVTWHNHKGAGWYFCRECGNMRTAPPPKSTITKPKRK